MSLLWLNISETARGENTELFHFTEILWLKASPFKGIINKNFPVRQSSSFQAEVILNSQFSILNS